MAGMLENEQKVEQEEVARIILNPTTYIVDFTENDGTNPLNWRQPYKWLIVILVASLSAVVQLSTIIAAPVSPPILIGFHSNNALYRTLIVSIWELGEIVAPLIWGPLSELYGRRWVLNIANALFITFHVGTALSTNIQMLIAFRFLSGAATASLPIGPGIVRDLFEEERRGRAMSVMSMTSTLGAVAGPIVGSYLAEREGWRWAFWLPTIVAGALALLLLATYRETYQVIILERKARQRRREKGNLNWRSRYETGETDASTSTAVVSKIFHAFVRPLRLLVRSPILILVTVYISVVYGYTYLMMTTIAPVFQEIYGFSTGASGLCFLGLCLGLTLGAFICSFVLDRYIRMAKAKASSVQAQEQTGSEGPSSSPSPITPEHRLPPVLFSCILMSTGFFLFGWTVHAHVHFIVPIIGTAVIGLGLVATTISLQTYIVDVFGIFAVSATSAMLVPRNASAAFLPLAGPPLFQRLGYHWGGTLLGLVVLTFAVMPAGFMKWGARLRGRGLADGSGD